MMMTFQVHTDLYIALSHPAQGFHRLSARVGVLGTLIGRVADILLNGRGVFVAHDLLEQVCCLGHRHFEPVIGVYRVLGIFGNIEWFVDRKLGEGEML